MSKDAIDAMFNQSQGTEGAEHAGEGKSPQPSPEAAPPNPAAPDASPPTDGPARPEWAPENFWDGKTGEVNVQNLSKSWSDGRAEITRLQQRVSELSKQEETIPETPDAYWHEMDYGQIAKDAPNAFAYTGGEDNETIKALMTAAHQSGVPPAKAREFAHRYLSTLEPSIPEMKTPEQRHLEAVGYLGPNGQRIANDVHAWLSSRAEEGAFSDEQVEFLGEAVRHGPALSTLWTLMRQVQPSGPPTGRATQQVSTEHARADLKRRMKDETNWKDPAKRREMVAEFNSLPPGPESFAAVPAYGPAP